MKHRGVYVQRASPRLSSRHERLAWIILGITWASGVLWLVFHYFLQQPGEFGPLPHPLEGWWLRLHGAGAFATLWLLGLLWGVHMTRAWSLAQRRRSGLSMGITAGVLVLSGFALYYGGEDLRASAAVVHWGLGLATLPLALLHMRRRAAQRRAHAATAQRLHRGVADHDSSNSH